MGPITQRRSRAIGVDADDGLALVRGIHTPAVMPDFWYQLDELGVEDVRAEDVAQILVVAATTLESVAALERCRAASVQVGSDPVVLHPIEDPDVTSPESGQHVGYGTAPHVRNEAVHAIQVLVAGNPIDELDSAPV